MPEWDKSWYRVLFSFDDEGNPIVGDDSGDWDTADRYPDYREFQWAWAEYFEWVVKNGDDPLGEIWLQKKSHLQSWEFLASNSILGRPVVRGVRRYRKGRKTEMWVHPRQAPSDVVEFLQMETKGPSKWTCTIGGGQFRTVEELMAKAENVKWARSGTRGTVVGRFDVYSTIPQDPQKRAAELRRLARKQLKLLKER